MKPCRYLWSNRVVLIVGTVIFSATALICVCAAVIAVAEFFHYPRLDGSQYILGSITIIFTLAIASFVFFLEYKFYTMETRKYSVSDKGLTLSDKGKCFYEWSEISEISIIAYGASASLANYQSVICVFLVPRPDEFLKKIIRSAFFGALNQRSFVIIDYSKHIAEEFAAFYPCEIKDYRDIQLK